MTIVGIDIGLNGGIAVKKKNEMNVIAMPTITGTKKKRIAVQTIKEILRNNRVNSTVYIEEGIVMPGQGISSSGSFMRQYGIIEGICIGLEIPYAIVNSRTWKAAILRGTAKDKLAAIEFVQRMYPTVNIRTSSNKKFHDGKADAICIAYYGYLQNNKEKL